MRYRQELVREILDEARWSPSWANTQAWNIYVVSGETLQALKSAGKSPGDAQDCRRSRLSHAS